MTPAEHLAKAEEILSTTAGLVGPPMNETGRTMTLAALAHAVVALAAELGVPHQQATTGGGDSGA